ncbi:MAG TPA: hypothetical protein VGF26_01230 [Ramlibacter sp.]
MTIPQVLILLALTLYAVYRQSIRHVVVGKSRFKLAIVYAIVGVSVGGYYLPPDAASWAALLGSLLASVVVGLVRGRYTRLYPQPDGRVFSQGTPFTIGLFLLLVGGKFALGTWQYLHGNHPHGGFGEVLLMIAAMAAMQAQIIWQRVQALDAGGARAPLAVRP